MGDAITDEDLANRLAMSALRLTRGLREQSKTSPLGEPQISALAVVVHLGRVTAKSLARIEGVTPSAISRLAASLEGGGYLRRETDAKDGRVQWLIPTEEGLRLTVEGRRRRLGPLTGALSKLSGEDRQRLTAAAEILDRLSRTVARAART